MPLPMVERRTTLQKLKRKVSFDRRFKWSITDRDKFFCLLGELEKMNNALESQFTATQKWTLQALLPTQYSAVTEVAELEDVRSVSEKHPFLERAIKLRSVMASIQCDGGVQVSLALDAALTKLRVSPGTEGSNYSRASIILNGSPWPNLDRRNVLIEWK